MQFQIIPFQTYAILKHEEEIEITFLKTYTKFFFAGIKVQWYESGGRIMLGDKTKSGMVMLSLIMFHTVGLQISTRLPHIYTYYWPYVHPILTCTRPFGM